MTKLLTPQSQLGYPSPIVLSPESNVDNSSIVSNQTEETRFFCVSMLDSTTLHTLHQQLIESNHNYPELIASLHDVVDSMAVQKARFDVFAAVDAVVEYGNRAK